MPLAVVAACLLTIWLGWRRRLPLDAALMGLGAGLAVIVLYVAFDLGFRGLGSDPTYNISELLLIERLPPGSFFVVIGYLMISYSIGSIVVRLTKALDPTRRSDR